jgi:hypothetical protein
LRPVRAPRRAAFLAFFATALRARLRRAFEEARGTAAVTGVLGANQGARVWRNSGIASTRATWARNIG